jgi:hypothetical protein
MIFGSVARDIIVILYKLGRRYLRKDIFIDKKNNRISKAWITKVDYWLKPVFLCPVCMPSIWSSPAFLWMGGDWYLLPLWVFCMSGLNYIISQLISKEMTVV